MKRYALKGINDDSTVCSVCGRVELKKVMWLVELDSEGNETGDPFHCGTTCGARLLGYTQSVVRTKVEQFSYFVSRRRREMKETKAKEIGYYTFLSELNRLNLYGKERRNHPLYAQMQEAENTARAWADNQPVVMEL